MRKFYQALDALALMLMVPLRQSLAIRRLKDDDKKTGSLLRLVDEMERNQHLMTREVFVGFDGTPWEAGEIERRIVHPETGQVDELAYQTLSNSRRANDRFDLLRSETSDAPRRADDKVDLAVFRNLKSALSSPAIKRIRTRFDTSIAHACQTSQFMTLWARSSVCGSFSAWTY